MEHYYIPHRCSGVFKCITFFNWYVHVQVLLYLAALAVYTRSPTAYEALKGFGILQLPSVSSLKTFTSFIVESADVSEKHLAFARKQYNAMMEEKRTSGQLLPFSGGILIFDEVKVGLKVHYHAKSGKLIGLAMSADQLASLHDVYQTLQSEHRTEKASYVLQYLWRSVLWSVLHQ